MQRSDLLLAMTLAAISSTAIHAQKSRDEGKQNEPSKYDLDGTYGTLLYKGKAERKLVGNDYEYAISDLKLTFNPKGKTNSTDEIQAKSISISVTKKPASGTGPWQVLHRDAKPITVVLTKDSPTATLEKVTFVISKEKCDEADKIGFAISDGRVMWPMKLTEPMAAQSKANSRP